MAIAFKTVVELDPWGDRCQKRARDAAEGMDEAVVECVRDNLVGELLRVRYFVVLLQPRAVAAVDLSSLDFLYSSSRAKRSDQKVHTRTPSTAAKSTATP